MNKSELVGIVAEQAKLSRAQAERLVNAFFEAVTDALKRGEDVALIGFGSFAVRDRAARSGRNPRTGEVIEVPAGRAPAFRPGKALRDAISNNT
jgi:DNA-binding protein HU-beta